MADKNRVTADVRTGVGTFSFPRIFSSTKGKNDKGEDTYDIQFIIPKSQRDDVREILKAIKTVGEAKWGANWKKVRSPLRDGDAEKDELTEDGSTRGEKYPERLGCYFLNARSSRPIAVVGRDRTPIVNPDEVYGGSKGRINVTFYPYSSNGNHGIGCGLNGVQKVADGEAFGSGAPSVESMFDLLEDDDLDLIEVDEETGEEVAPAPAKKAAAPRKRAAAKPAPVAEEESDEDDDLYDDLDDDM